MYGTSNLRAAPIGFWASTPSIPSRLGWLLVFGGTFGLDYNGEYMANMRHQRSLHLIIGRLLWLGVGCMMLLGGCALLPSPERGDALEVEFEQVLPAGWEPLGRWQSVNLDADGDDEYLLFFRFDSGQVGALIYDVAPAPNASQTYNVSQTYHLLPRYFDDQGNLGQGVIAPPGMPADAIAVYQIGTSPINVELDEATPTGTAQIEGSVAKPELVIWGGNTHLTLVWWKDNGARESEADGTTGSYGVTQLYAPGGFGGVDWQAWQREPSSIQTVAGFYPLEDYRARSYICRLVLYTRRSDLSGIAFSALPQGLHFCDGTIPANPFAPEGVVLAYLLQQRPADDLLQPLLTPGTTLPQLDAESGYTRFAMERIEDVATYETTPLRAEQAQRAQEQASVIAPTTPVCVELAEQANPSIRRWVIFTLRYQPSDAAQRLPGRWTLSGAFEEPTPVQTPASGYCETILARSAP